MCRKLSPKIMLKDISSSGNCCKTKCTSLFQKYLNTSPMVYLNRYRLEKSVFLLQNTTMSVTEIAYTCGFSNSSYFCELFHKYYNTTLGSFETAIDKHYSYSLAYNYNGYFLTVSLFFQPVFHITSAPNINNM